jgi:excisionase family DNA binding protein
VPRYTDRPWWTVEDAAKLLRVNVHTLYRAVARNDFPHQKIGPYIKIPAEALLLTPLPDPIVQRVLRTQVKDEQLELPLDPPPVPVRLYRDGSPIRPWGYEDALWRTNKK